MPKPTSQKQIAANRRNAKRSTGPKTQEGIAVSSMNAMKHGILSKQVLVQGFTFQESSAELEALHLRFWEALQPVGAIEEMLVDQIVTAHWRLGRALAAESGAIAKEVDAIRQPGAPVSPLLLWRSWLRSLDIIHAMECSDLGTALLLDFLREMRKGVEEQGALTGPMLEKLAEGLGGKPNALSHCLDALRLRLEQNPDGLDAAALAARTKAETLADLDRRIADLAGLQAEREEINEVLEQAKASRPRTLPLPSERVLDQILRYETKLERQIYRAMAQLERMQRMRGGEAVPAPLSVEISGSA